MIIDEITIANFGIFQGEQRAVLTPPSGKKPIVLFGGLNGAGKTTLLEAVQFVLYGKLSTFVRNKNTAYEDYLERRINKNVPPGEGAYVELKFRSTEDGQEHELILRRAFAMGNKGAVEDFDVQVDGRFDETLAETWIEHVDRFVPSRLSHFFFFDGEQIEALAETGHAGEVFHAAINALLGVDLVEQLKTDLTVLQRRKQKERQNIKDVAEIETLEERIEEINQVISSKKQELSNLQNKIDRALKLKQELETRFSQQGGDLYARHQEFEEGRKEAAKQKETLQRRLIELASGALPLALTRDFLMDIRKQIECEREAAQSQIVTEELKKRDRRLFTFMKKSDCTAEQLRGLQEFLQQDLSSYEQSAEHETYLDVDASVKTKIDILLESVLDRDLQDARMLLNEYETVERNIDEFDRKLAAVPDEDALSKIFEDQKKNDERLKDLQAAFERQSMEIERLKRERDDSVRELDRKYEKSKEYEVRVSDLHRIIKHSGRLQETLSVFKEKVVARNVEKLSKLILESYTLLLRKQAFIHHIDIDPQTYSLSLRNGKQQEIQAHELSAGERQLLAVSMLWALGRASGKPIPVIIDTPLGRLDASHRINLVEHYFPFASHQVLLLSTDEEIDERYYERLKKWVGHSYMLNYDEAAQSSSLDQGYFW